MSEEMIEKVAQALHEASCKDYRVRDGGDLSSWPEDYREHQRVLARAAIAAYNPNERLREALERIANHMGRHMKVVNGRSVDVTHHDLSEIARAALKSTLPQVSIPSPTRQG